MEGEPFALFTNSENKEYGFSPLFPVNIFNYITNRRENIKNTALKISER
jgi:hypothetical protein